MPVRQALGIGAPRRCPWVVGVEAEELRGSQLGHMAWPGMGRNAASIGMIAKVLVGDGPGWVCW